MCVPCVYLTRPRSLRLLRRLENPTCGRPHVGIDAREPKKAITTADTDRGYNRVCPHGPRSRPSKHHEELETAVLEAWGGNFFRLNRLSWLKILKP